MGGALYPALKALLARNNGRMTMWALIALGGTFAVFAVLNLIDNKRLD